MPLLQPNMPASQPRPIERTALTDLSQYQKFGIDEDSADNTAALNNYFAYLTSGAYAGFIPSGTYKHTGQLTISGAMKLDAYGVYFEHYPTNDTTDALVITGLDAGRTIINGLGIRGMMNGHTFGRDLIRISKGDYITLRDLYLYTPKRDFVNIRPTSSNQWIENMLFENVKLQHVQSVTTLTGAGIPDAVATSFTVNNASAFPDYVPFNVFCENEIMTVGALDKTTNTMSSVTRGVDGSTAVAHTSGKKLQTRRGRDGFHYEIQGVGSESYKPFINQITMINCETRSVARYCVHLLNTITSASTAAKISCLRIFNGEYGAAAGPDAIIRIEGNEVGNFPIENITIEDVAIEQTEQERTGYGIEISGQMSGLLKVENNIIFGNTLGKFTGYEQFPHWFIRDVGSTAFVKVYNSHSGIYKGIRTTATLTAGTGFEDVHTLVKGEYLKGFVVSQDNANDNADHLCEFSTAGKNIIWQTSPNASVTMSVVAGQLRVTNSNATGGNKKLEVYIYERVNTTDF